MKLGRKKISVLELNSNVEFVQELQSSDINPNIMPLRPKQVDGRIYSTTIAETMYRGGESIIKSASEDGKTVTVHNLTTSWVEGTLRSLPSQSINVVRDAVRDKDGNRHDMFHLLAIDTLKYIRQTFKINKNDVMTTANFVRMLCFCVGCTIENKDLKETINAFKVKSKKFYLYKTQKYVAEHYATLAEKENLSSCMTKGMDDLAEHSHLVPTSLDKAIEKEYLTVSSRKDRLNDTYTTATFTANVEGYSGGDFYLGLVSALSPEEIKSAEDYAFIGRVIIFLRSDGWHYSRYYGNEIAYTSVTKSLKKGSGEGLKFRAYRSITAWAADGIKSPRFITPYIDGGKRHFTVDMENPKHDEYGRLYYDATVLDVDSSSFDCNDIPNLKTKAGIYKLSQRAWISEEELWYGTCVVTGEEVRTGTGRFSDKFGGLVSYSIGRTDYSIDTEQVKKLFKAKIQEKLDFIARVASLEQEKIQKLMAKAQELGVNLDD